MSPAPERRVSGIEIIGIDHPGKLTIRRCAGRHRDQPLAGVEREDPDRRQAASALPVRAAGQPRAPRTDCRSLSPRNARLSSGADGRAPWRWRDRPEAQPALTMPRLERRFSFWLSFLRASSVEQALKQCIAIGIERQGKSTIRARLVRKGRERIGNTGKPGPAIGERATASMPTARPA